MGAVVWAKRFERNIGLAIAGSGDARCQNPARGAGKELCMECCNAEQNLNNWSIKSHVSITQRLQQNATVVALQALFVSM